MSSTLRGTIVLCSCLRKRHRFSNGDQSWLLRTMRHISTRARADVGCAKVFSIPRRDTSHGRICARTSQPRIPAFVSRCLSTCMPFSGFVFTHISTFFCLWGWGGFFLRQARGGRERCERRGFPVFHLKDFRKEPLQLLGGSISVELHLELLRRGATGGILLLLTGLRHQLRL